jgi:long-chain fatty acid transport protein
MHTQLSRLSPVAAVCAALCAVAQPAWATNGMLMEGYGPVSTGMGGASQALDHGTAAMAQNPATLALMPTRARHDAAIGVLGPKVASSMAGAGTAESSGNAYVMPALGYARRSGSLTYGFGLFAQGGMGTEYSENTFLAMGSGAPVRSELGVGSLLFPLAWQLTPTLAVGATLDFMWAGLDMRMAASGMQLGAMVTGASGNLAMALPALGGAPWARVDFSNNNDFTGAAKSTGWGAKLGVVYKPTQTWTLGASYRLKSALSDMKTTATDASLSATGGFADSGRITVVDFQFPAMAALGASWQITPDLLVAADYKRIAWAAVMKDFKLRYDSAGMGGSVSFALPQNWKNQSVVNLGLAYAVNPQITLRGGINASDNPIPEALVNPLFPATVKRHYTMGAGWRFTPADEVNLSLTLAPTSTVTNGMGVVVTHKQTNLQIMYSRHFL